MLSSVSLCIETEMFLLYSRHADNYKISLSLSLFHRVMMRGCKTSAGSARAKALISSRRGVIKTYKRR